MDRKIIIGKNIMDGVITIRATNDDGASVDTLFDIEIEEIKNALEDGGFKIFGR